MPPPSSRPFPAADRNIRPRVAIIQKSDGLLTWCQDLVSAFRDAGAVTSVINFRPASLSERWSQHVDRQRLLFNPATCQRLAKSMALFAPDLVLVLNYPGLPECAATAMRAALRPGVPMFGWLCDQLDEFPARFEPILDGVYYFDSACLPVLEDSYAGTHARLEFLPLAACPQRYACPSLDLRSRIPRLAFAGNCTPSRQAFFSEYRRLGQALDLFGPHAGNWPRVWRNCKLPPAALAQVYRGYLINLNLLQPGNTTHGLNLRAFEIPSAGGLATYPEVRDLARCFTPNQEILVYTSASDLAAIVGNILQQPDQALAITRAGHSRVMREHTFYHRATRMLGDWIGSSFKPNIPDYIASSA